MVPTAWFPSASLAVHPLLLFPVLQPGFALLSPKKTQRGTYKAHTWRLLFLRLRVMYNWLFLLFLRISACTNGWIMGKVATLSPGAVLPLLGPCPCCLAVSDRQHFIGTSVWHGPPPCEPHYERENISGIVPLLRIQGPSKRNAFSGKEKFKGKNRPAWSNLPSTDFG